MFLRGDELRPSYTVQPGPANGMNNNALRTHIVDEFLPEFDLMDLNIPSKDVARRVKHRLDINAEIDFIITLTSPSPTSLETRKMFTSHRAALDSG